jgi:hypothetical protein
MKKLLLYTIVFMLAASCAGRKQLTPEEAEAERERQIQMVTRVYEGKSQKDVLMAADRIFRLDDSDYVISHAETSLVAKRNWMLYMVLATAFGTDTWAIETFQEGNATKVITRHSGQSQSMVPTPTMGFNGQMGMTGSTGPAMQGMSTWSGPYRLFYERMDYLLGKRTDWVRCRDAKEGYEGNLDPLCMCAEDLLPDGTSYKKAAPAKKDEE